MVTVEEWAYNLIKTERELNEAQEEVKRLKKKYEELSEYGLKHYYEVKILDHSTSSEQDINKS